MPSWNHPSCSLRRSACIRSLRHSQRRFTVRPLPRLHISTPRRIRRQLRRRRPAAFPGLVRWRCSWTYRTWSNPCRPVPCLSAHLRRLRLRKVLRRCVFVALHVLWHKAAEHDLVDLVAARPFEERLDLLERRIGRGGFGVAVHAGRDRGERLGEPCANLPRNAVPRQQRPADCCGRRPGAGTCSRSANAPRLNEYAWSRTNRADRVDDGLCRQVVALGQLRFAGRTSLG